MLRTAHTGAIPLARPRASPWRRQRSRVALVQRRGTAPGWLRYCSRGRALLLLYVVESKRTFFALVMGVRIASTTTMSSGLFAEVRDDDPAVAADIWEPILSIRRDASIACCRLPQQVQVRWSVLWPVWWCWGWYCSKCDPLSKASYFTWRTTKLFFRLHKNYLVQKKDPLPWPLDSCCCVLCAVMRAVLALAATWLACLCSFSLGLSPAGAAAVSVSACQMSSPHVEVEEQEQAATPYTGLPGTSRERSFFVS